METKHIITRWVHLFDETTKNFFINKNVLDIGCLDGYSTNQFIKYGASKATGLDIEKEYINRAIKQYPNINFKIEDAEQITNFKDVDVISCLGLIYLLNNPIKFLDKISLQNQANTIIIETVNNTKNTYIVNNYHVININIIKKIFTNNNWNLSFEKVFLPSQMNCKFDNEINFGNRIILIFERKL